MTKLPKEPKPAVPNWQRKRKPKYRDMYVKSRTQESWKRFRKRQTWRND